VVAHDQLSEILWILRYAIWQQQAADILQLAGDTGCILIILDKKKPTTGVVGF
jgi:hypothetical protein